MAAAAPDYSTEVNECLTKANLFQNRQSIKDLKSILEGKTDAEAGLIIELAFRKIPKDTNLRCYLEILIPKLPIEWAKAFISCFLSNERNLGVISSVHDIFALYRAFQAVDQEQANALIDTITHSPTHFLRIIPTRDDVEDMNEKLLDVVETLKKEVTAELATIKSDCATEKTESEALTFSPLKQSIQSETKVVLMQIIMEQRKLARGYFAKYTQERAKETDSGAGCSK